MRLSVIEFAMKHFMAAKANPCIHNMSSRIKLCVRGLCFGWRAREIVNAENGERKVCGRTSGPPEEGLGFHIAIDIVGVSQCWP